MGDWYPTMPPIEKALRANLTLPRKLRRTFSGLSRNSYDQIEHLIRRIHTSPKLNKMNNRSKQYVCYHLDARVVTSCL